MKIAHFTNTFLPHVGGVARAVQTLLEDQRRARHRVLVVAPEFDEGPAPARIEASVVRIPAFTRFNDSEFSVSIPFATLLSERLAEFRTDLNHTHHPFLLGDTALREASTRQVPLVFTHHTLYENYVHYLPVDSEAMAEFAAGLNKTTQDIGARRLHTIMEKLLEDLSFNAPDMKGKSIVITGDTVRGGLADIAANEDLSRYIL